MSIEQLERMRSGHGFIAALDQSGGSTPHALECYGIPSTAYADEAAMFDLVHEMRTRIMTSPVFTGERILGAILFLDTMRRTVAGMGAAEYLWQVKHVVPFLKVDLGLEGERHGAKLMKPIPDLDATLAEAVGHGVFGTKLRSVIRLADRTGVEAVVDQQLDLAQRILDAGLVPIIEPEIDIHSAQKEAAEDLLRESLLHHLDRIPEGQQVMLKLTLPEENGFHTKLVEHPRVLRVAALSGGYPRAEAVERLADQPGVIASFSRALTEGLTAQQSQADFDHMLDASIASIYRASTT
ncbi:MAG: fructose bisphosphate aldolase [Frankiales bacterium]|nr:fructose bisphosphate aldolase [Frankiales bacterium]